MTLGTLMKIHAVYQTPFWREDPGVWMALKPTIRSAAGRGR